MNNSPKSNIFCSNCKNKLSSQIFGSLNVTLNPEFKDMIFKDKIFKWVCPKCNHVTNVLYPFLYHDMEYNFMIYFIPNILKNKITPKFLNKNFRDISEIQKRMVYNVNSLKENILIFENLLSDKAIELTKFAILKVATQKHSKNFSSVYFKNINPKNGYLEFILRSSDDFKEYHQSINPEIYNKSFEILSKDDKKNSNKFLNIDLSWAKETLNKT